MSDLTDIGREYLPILLFFGVAIAFAVAFAADSARLRSAMRS